MDDFLPVKDGRLYKNESEDFNEFWSALLEKAYAKIHGSYDALDWGFMMDALLDMTGGCIETTFGLDNPDPKEIFQKMYKVDQLRGLMACAFNGEGIDAGHAYAITKVIILRHEGTVKIFENFDIQSIIL